MLGVSYRTLARAADTGWLTGRMADAWKSHLLRGVRSPAEERKERAAVLEKRIVALEGGLTDVAETFQAGFEVLRADVGSAHETLLRLLDELG